MREEPDMTKSIHSGDSFLGTSQRAAVLQLPLFWSLRTFWIMTYFPWKSTDRKKIATFADTSISVPAELHFPVWTNPESFWLYSRFSSFVGVLLYKVSSNTDLANAKTTAPRGNTELGSCEPLAIFFSNWSIRNFIFCVFLFKTTEYILLIH